MDPLDELVGQSPAIAAVRDTLRRLVAHQAPGRRPPAVLLQGETGSGKGLVARLIHRLGPRAEGPFVDVNCAAIPETLLEAELFGFERGAFTDARRSKPGLFQTAHRGTIFLDEIALLPASLQAKLLTVIEERRVRRLGGTDPEPTDAWIISATNVDLPAAVRAHQFREDLYHRLAVVPVRLPPLRERPQDILLLAEDFLRRICADYSLPPKTLPPEARQRLLAHSWPGNVRELANVLERAVLLGDEATLKASHLQLGEAPAAAAPTPSGVAPVSIDDAMREHLHNALDRTGWNISRTAAILGISRNTLRARIEKLGLRRATPAPSREQRGEPPAGVAAPSPPSTVGSAPAPAQVDAPLRAAPPSGGPLPIGWERRRIIWLRASLVSPEAPDELPDTSRALEVLIAKIETFGGRVEEMGQTGLDASFGVEPLEDAPRRAVNAALTILRAGQRGRAQSADMPGVKIAIHAGPYTVGQISGHTQIDQVAKRQVNAILEALVTAAEPDSVFASAPTVPFLERRFELVPAGPATVAAGQPHRLVGRETTGPRLFGRMARFVGRHQELDLLNSLWVSARQGHGQLVALVGEPGVGKSRLLWEFAHGREASRKCVLETASVALGHPAPYLPVIELLRSYFEIEAGTEPDSVRERIATRLRSLDESLVPTLPALLALLDVPVSDPQWHALSPSQRRQRTFDAVKRLLLRESRNQPVLLVFEDMHWIDAETQALLDTIVDGLPTAHMLLLLTYRPEYRHGWGSRSFYTQLRVDPLQAENAGELLTTLLGVDRSLEPLKPLLIEWTEGNPFFIEETIRTLVETDALHGERGDYRLVKPVTGIQVPATVEEVLAARIDRLASGHRGLLQSAAVIGKDVPHAVLAAIVDLPDEVLGESLRQLQVAELLYETATSPEPGYTFKHALTHEVAYGSVAQGRRGLHAHILEVMETLYGDRLMEHIDRFAHHALRGQVWDKALPYLRRAGARALGRSAHREAAAFFEQALDVTRHLPETRETQDEAIDLCIDLRNALTLLPEPQRTLDHLRLAEGLATRIGDRRRLGRVLSFEANCLFLLGQHESAIEAGQRALDIAAALDDAALETATEQYVGRAHHALGNYRRGVEIFGAIVRSLTGDLVRSHFGLPVLPAVFSRAHLAMCLAESGAFDEATRHVQDATRLAEGTNHPDTLLWAHRGTGLVHLVRGDGATAGRALEPALVLCQTYNMPTYVARVSSELALAYALSGRLTDALSFGTQALENAEATKQTANISGILLRLGEVYLGLTRLPEAEAAAAKALALFRSQHERGNEAHAIRLLADVLGQRDLPDCAGAERAYGESMALAQELGMRPLAARCSLGLGLLQGQRGDRATARDSLAAAAAGFREMGMTVWLGQADAALTRLA
ncbi:MAG: sigma 54-interacting transcriptional regulator [Candidatus Rokuibacteriota bacterium]